MALPEFSFSLGGAGGSGGGGGKGRAADTNVTTTAVVSANYADSLRLTEDDKVNVYVTYASLLSKARRLKDANKVLSKAKVTFAGTRQEVQVLVAASQLYVEKGQRSPLSSADIRSILVLCQATSTRPSACWTRSHRILRSSQGRSWSRRTYS